MTCACDVSEWKECENELVALRCFLSAVSSQFKDCLGNCIARESPEW